MPDLRFKGLAAEKPGPGFPNMVKQLCGYQVIQDGADWIVLASDPVLASGPRNCLRLHGQVKLSHDNLSDAARQLASAVPSSFDKYYRADKRQIRFVVDEPTKLNEIYCRLTELTIAQPDEVQSLLADRILPFMVNEMDCIAATPVTIDSEYQQAFYSLTKFAFLLYTHSVQDTEDLVFNKQAMSGILPSQLAPLDYVNALTRLAPLALTLPIARVDCAWHFQADAMWSFTHVQTEGIYQQFLSDLAPTAEGPSILGLSGLRGMTESNIWRYLRLVIEGINRLFCYLNDPRSFQDANTGEADFGKQLQAYGAINLLFADLIALNYSTNSYHRINTAMSALDKIANLKKYLGDVGDTEGAIFRKLATASHGEMVERLCAQRAQTASSELADSLINTIKTTYRNIHEHLRTDMGARGQSEEARIERLRFQRNLRHGAFLEGQKFDALFGESKGTVPDDLVSLPFLLTLGLIFDPHAFLSFRPTVSSGSGSAGETT